MTNNNPTPIPPPRVTMSFSLLLCSLTMLLALCLTYFYWYKTGELSTSATDPDVIIAYSGDDLNAIIKQASAGSIIEVTPGNWEVNLQIIGKKDISLRSHKKDQNVIIWSAAGKVVEIKNTQGCTIENLKFYSEDDGPLVSIANSQGIKIHENVFDKSFSCIRIQSECSEIYLEKNKINFRERGVYISNSSNLHIVGNDFQSTEQGSLAISAIDIQQIQIENNEIISHKGIGIKNLRPQKTFQNVIIKNTIQAQQKSIELNDCHHIRFANNKMESQESAAFVIEKCKEIEVGTKNLENHVKSKMSCALLLKTSEKISILNGIFHNQTKESMAVSVQFCHNVSLWKTEISGLVIHKEATKVVEDSRGGGILVTNSKTINITECSIKDSSSHGVTVDNSSGVVIVGNKISKNVKNGLEIEKSNVQIGPKNQILENIGEGIRIRKSQDGQIYENNISKNQGVGVELEESSLKVVANHIKNNGKDGLSLKYSDSKELRGNVFEENIGYGIRFTQIKQVPWKDNEFKGNRLGESNRSDR